jgi:hypothetical protein
MRKDKVLQKIKDELSYYKELLDYINYDYYNDDNNDYDDYIVMYEYLPKEKQINKFGLLIDMESFYSKDKIRSLRLDVILASI